MNPPIVAKKCLTRLILAALIIGIVQIASAAPIAILFVGNSFTFGRVDPVMSYNAVNVHDLTAGFNAINSTGSNPWEPHPWGGVAGIFKQMTMEKGLDYDVSISARNAASLRGQFLNTATTAWDLRGNVASRSWDVVVLQEQSDATLPTGKGKNANPAQFKAYADKFEAFIHNGLAQNYTETQLYGSLPACQATGQTTSQCSTVRTTPANLNANANAKVYLTDTWARPDMVYSHKITLADTASADGRPIVDSSAAGGVALTFYPSLTAMTKDLHDSIHGLASANPGYAGVIGVGDAFQRAFDQGAVKTSAFYNAAGIYTMPQAGDLMSLWWDDYLHASKYGSYLDALMQFGTITGLNPLSLGAGEIAAFDLGIASADALTLQRIAAEQLGFSAVPEPAMLSMTAPGLNPIRFTRARRASD